MKLLCVDGNSILNRAFYGVRPLTTKDGQPTNAIYGFLTMLGKITDDVKPDEAAIAFDMRAPTFRHIAYSGYKAKRKGMPPELAAQLDPLKSLLMALGYTLVTCEGWEADDILGTLADACDRRGDACVIATGDRDTLQLVSDNVTVRLLTTKNGRPEAVLYDKAAIKEVYGLEPHQLIDIKAIQGDTSDNIPGVPGIGEKGAAELIGRFGSLEGVYANIDSEHIKPGTRTKLAAGEESAKMSYMLGTVRRDAPINTAPGAYAIAQPDAAAVRSQMTALELFSLLSKLKLPETGAPMQASSPEEKAELDVRFVSCDEAVRLAREKGKCDIYFESAEDRITAAALCSEKQTCVLESDAERFVLELAGDAGVKKRTHDLKTLARVCLANGIEPQGFEFDSMLAAYLANPSGSDYSLERLCAQYARSTDGMPDILGSAASAAQLTTVCDALEKAVENAGMTPLLRDVELKLAVVLADMELAGFLVDSEGLESFRKVVSQRADELEKAVWAETGMEFNLNSPKQVGTALFEKLMLPGGKKTKTGWSTSADVLEGLRHVHPAVDMLLQYRTLSKLNSTYCVGLLSAIAQDGRIHTSFNQTETRTGRISSAEPNLQNIPVRTPLGRELRRCFIPREGCVLIDADYSQIELRVLAHMAGDGNMLDAFRSGEDVHTRTAAQVFGVPDDAVTSEMRSRAKAVNFGIVYGISAYSLANDIGVSRNEAQAYIDGYMSHYSAVGEYMTRSVEEAKRLGYSQTLYGRRRYLPELGASNFNTRAFGERVARNMPIQGTAADIIKTAMVKVRERLRRENMSARLIMQVHDELILEAPQEEAQRALELLREEMMNAAQLSVPLVADANIGKTWLDAK